MLQAVLLGGLFIGVLSALPLVAVANCCCLWIIGGGALTAYLLQQSQSAPISPADGVVAGLGAGVVGAVVYAVVAIPVRIVTAPIERQMVQRLIESAADVPPQVRDMIESMGQAGPGGMVFGFLIMLIAGMAFSTLGGLLGAIVFKRSAPAPDVPPEGR